MTLVADRRSTGGVVIAAIGSAAALYIFAEAIPRIWALQHIDRAALRSARILRVLLRIRAAPSTDPPAHCHRQHHPPRSCWRAGRFRRRTLGDDGSGGCRRRHRGRRKGTHHFGVRPRRPIVREVMVPRTDMTAVSSDDTISAVLDLADEKGFSRLPVFGDGIDDIVGVCLVKDLVRVERAGGGDRTVVSLMRKARFVPETKHADHCFESASWRSPPGDRRRRVRRHRGLVTLEDVVEELVGEIVDETDREEPLVRPLAGGKLLVHGRMPVDQLESLLELEFVDGDWDTVGGLIFSVLGHVPEVGETVDSNGVQLRVERMEGRRITSVSVDQARAEAGS